MTLVVPNAFAQQNLVPNPSFEVYDTCPNNGGQIEYSTYWSNPTLYATPDYFNFCGTAGYGTPNTYFGNEPALSGNAYAGILTYSYDPINPPACRNKREYIQIALSDTLNSGRCYRVSFYVRLADSAVYAANSIGAYFADSPTTLLIDTVLQVSPQIDNNASSNPLTNKNSWTLVLDSFVAAGSETHMIIGNFNEDALTDTVNMTGAPWFMYAYYLIENVEVIPCDSVNSVADADPFEHINIYPNPSQDILNLKWSWQEQTDIRLIDCLGKEVIHWQCAPGVQTASFSVEYFSSGMYMLEVRSAGSYHIEKIIIK